MTVVASEKARQGMVREALADILIDRAAWTHARLHAGRNHGVELHEETITQDLLLDISAAFPAMSVRTFTKRQEARNGTDWQWEWWFGDQRWFGLRVQAKRLKQLKPSQLGYHLDYKVRRDKKSLYQVDLLLDEARADGVEAAYVLYNGPDLDISKVTWGCRRLPPSPAFFGVSLLPATIAQDLVYEKTVDFATVGALSRPWSCLASCDPFNCPQLWQSEAFPLSHFGAVSESLSWQMALSFFGIEVQARRIRKQDAEQDFPLIPRNVPGLLDQPPAYVVALLNRDRLPDDALPSRVGAMTVFQMSSESSPSRP